jgi:hypothetical protein
MSNFYGSNPGHVFKNRWDFMKNQSSMTPVPAHDNFNRFNKSGFVSRIIEPHVESMDYVVLKKAPYTPKPMGRIRRFIKGATVDLVTSVAKTLINFVQRSSSKIRDKIRGAYLGFSYGAKNAIVNQSHN